MNSQVIEQKLAAHIDAWRERMFAVTPTNRHMAELGINALYRRVCDQEPKAIIWCESPYQFSLIPYMVTNVICNPPWKRLVRELAEAGDPGSDSWNDAWTQGWNRIKGGQITRYEQFAPEFETTQRQQPHVPKRAIHCLGKHLRAIAANGKISPGMLSADSWNAEDDDLPRWTPRLRFKFQMSILDIAAKVGKVCRVRSRFGSMRLLTSLTFGALDEPNWDNLLPSLDELFKGSDRTRTLPDHYFQSVRTHYDPLEFDAAIMTAWYSSLIQGAAFTFALWMPYSIPWLAFASAAPMIDSEVFDKEVQQEIDMCAYLAYGALGYFCTDQICYVCEKPTMATFDENRRPHYSAGPSLIWPDGYQVYCWKGTRLDPRYILDKDSITTADVYEQRNAELRRALIDIYGEARFLLDSRADKIHEDVYGILWRLELEGDEPLVMVQVKNSTPEPDGTFKSHFLRVPPTIRRAKEGIAWTFGLAESEYNPKIES